MYIYSPRRPTLMPHPAAPPLPAAPAGLTYDLLQLRANWHRRAKKHSGCGTGYEAQQPRSGHSLVKCENHLLCQHETQQQSSIKRKNPSLQSDCIPSTIDC